MWNQPRPRTASGLDPQTLQLAGAATVLACVYLWRRYRRSRRCRTQSPSGAACCPGPRQCSGCASCRFYKPQCSKSLGARAVDSLLALKDSAHRSVRFYLGASSCKKRSDLCCSVPCASSCCPGVGRCAGCSYCKKASSSCSKSLGEKIVDGILSIGNLAPRSLEFPWGGRGKSKCSPCYSAPCGPSCMKSTLGTACTCYRCGVSCPKECTTEEIMYEITITKGVMSAPQKIKVKCS